MVLVVQLLLSEFGRFTGGAKGGTTVHGRLEYGGSFHEANMMDP